MSAELRHGRWEDALADVLSVGALIVDGPYSVRTHGGQDELRSDLGYEPWFADDVRHFVRSWSPRTLGWMACFTDSVLAESYVEAYEACGRCAFAPIPVIAPMPRLQGDGPSSDAVYLCVARPREKRFMKWGSLPGHYLYTREQSVTGVLGAKPLALMRQIVRHYSQPGDLVVDPCAGGATTLIAATLEGRLALGAERDRATYEKALERMRFGDQALRNPNQTRFDL